MGEDETPRLYRVILPVGDIEQAAAFYGALLGVPGQRVSPGRHYFDCHGTILACYESKADGDGDRPLPTPDPFQYLYFAVDDLASVYRRALEAGATLDSEIAVKPWGETLFYARDPFGGRICFVDASTLFTGT